ncbi:MAG: SDR family NAD(P)-dependent oxidoreductase [Bacteroidales bacterium]|nr:SDR family NAD(P)-dependent oxidoreductase [Bacteroidales bacterium]
MEKTYWTLENMPDLSGKIIIVTGGNSGLGYESVKAFAEKGAEVILASRSVEKGLKVQTEIEKLTIKGKIEVMQLDLQDFASIEKFAENFKQKYQKLDVLLNNAGIMTTPYFKTKDGLEGQIGTNHFGHFKLTGLLLDIIKSTPKSRVVNISSIAHERGKMYFDNLMFENGKEYTPMKSYGQSKLANLLFTYELQRYFEANNIDSISVAAHPGVSKTNLAQHLLKKFWVKLFIPFMLIMVQSAERGALPGIRASVAEDVKGGDYYGPHKRMKGFPVKVGSTEESHNIEDAKKLWNISEEITGVKF